MAARGSDRPTDGAPVKDERGNSGSGGEPHQQAGGKHPALTTNQGLHISDDQNSLPCED
jgi:catalase